MENHVKFSLIERPKGFSHLILKENVSIFEVGVEEGNMQYFSKTAPFYICKAMDNLNI